MLDYGVFVKNEDGQLVLKDKYITTKLINNSLDFSIIGKNKLATHVESSSASARSKIMDKTQQLKTNILYSTLKLFAIVFPMLMVISISRSLDTGWQVLYSVQIFLVIVLLATYFLRNKISNANITIIITVFFFILGTAASFRNKNAMFYVFGTLIGFFYFSSYFSRRSTTFLGIAWGVSIGFIFYQIYGIMLDAIMFSIGIPFLTYLPTSLHLQYQENDKKVNHQLETALQSIKEKNKMGMN